jgi:hypothetical protein
MREMLKIGRWRGGEAEGFAGGWVNKTKGLRVQSLAREVQCQAPGGLRQEGGGGGAAAQIDRVADERMADGGEVDADLVGAAGGQYT